MNEKELTMYINTLQERDRWKIAYDVLFKTNEEHIDEIEADNDIIAHLERRVKYFADRLAPQHPCRLENDNPADEDCTEQY